MKSNQNKGCRQQKSINQLKTSLITFDLLHYAPLWLGEDAMGGGDGGVIILSYLVLISTYPHTSLVHLVETMHARLICYLSFVHVKIK